MTGRIRAHRELEMYQMAFELAVSLPNGRYAGIRVKQGISQGGNGGAPPYSLTDQIRRSSRSVCANLGEAWRRRRYQAAFVNKLNDCEAEATETQACRELGRTVWLEFAVKSGYLEAAVGRELYATYDRILGKLVTMIRNPQHWIIAQ